MCCYVCVVCCCVCLGWGPSPFRGTVALPPDSPPPDCPKFRSFFSFSCPHFRHFSLSLWGSSRGFLVAFVKAGTLKMCTFGLSGCGVKLRGAFGPPGLRTTRDLQTCAFDGPGASKRARSTSANFDFGQFFFFSSSANFEIGQFQLRPIRLRPISTSANFDLGQFLDVEFWDHKRLGPQGGAPKGVGPNL